MEFLIKKIGKRDDYWLVESNPLDIGGVFT